MLPHGLASLSIVFIMHLLRAAAQAPGQVTGVSFGQAGQL